jgi:hypothetical protein
MFVCVIFFGGGHGTWIPAILIFPFGMAIAVAMDQISGVAVLLAFVQYPLYMFIVAYCRGNRARIIAVNALMILHFAFAVWAMENKSADV